MAGMWPRDWTRATPSPPTKSTPITPTAGASSSAIFSRPPKALVLQDLFLPALLERQQPLRAGLGHPVPLQDACGERGLPLGLGARPARPPRGAGPGSGAPGS